MKRHSTTRAHPPRGSYERRVGGRLVRWHRHRLRLTYRELAEALNTTKPAIVYTEHGRSGINLIVCGLLIMRGAVPTRLLHMLLHGYRAWRPAYGKPQEAAHILRQISTPAIVLPVASALNRDDDDDFVS